MKRLMAVGFVLSLALLHVNDGVAEEIPFAERFALANHREVALRELIPGSEEYYYYHCLHLQNLQQFEKVEPLVDAWVQRHSVTPKVEEIRNRQALLTYEQSPETSLNHLRQTLNLRFDHQRRSRHAPVQLPTELDSTQIGDEAFLNRALSRHPNLQGIEDAGLWTIMSHDLKRQERRALLSRSPVATRPAGS